MPKVAVAHFPQNREQNWPTPGDSVTKQPIAMGGMSRFMLLLAAFLVLSAGCTPLTPVPVSGDPAVSSLEQDAINIDPVSGETSTTVIREDSQSVVDVVSENGIGAIIVELPAASTGRLVVRIHTSGLEEVTLMYDDRVVTAGIMTGVGTATHATVRIGDGLPRAIDAGDPDWLPLTAYRNDGSPAQSTPLPSGYFEVHLPQAFYESNSRRFELSWIDFYR